MPVAVSYPGVYVQEIASGSQTISGVSTSLTAFVGRTYRGPINIPVLLNSYADYQRAFGGLQEDFPVSYAVRDFFTNGGSQAVVVRIYGPSWVNTFPVSDDQTQNAQTAIKAVTGSLGEYTPDTPAATIAQTASTAASQYLGNPHPEMYQAANALAQVAANWSQAVGAAKAADLASFLSGITGLMQTGANQVTQAITNPASYPAPFTDETVLSSPPPTDLEVVEAAYTAASQLPAGPVQDAGMLVYNAVLQAYQEQAGATFGNLDQAAIAANQAVQKAAQAVAAVTPTSSESAEQYVQAVVTAVNPMRGTELQAGMIAVDALFEQLLPTLQLAPGHALNPGLPLGEWILDDAVVQQQALLTALPVTTAAVPLQAPANFSVVATAAHQVAEAAWLAWTEGLNTAAVAAAAQTAVTDFRANNPTAPAQAVQAATAVAQAAQQNVLSKTASAPAAAATAKVAGAVQAAMQLDPSNGAVTALAGAEQVSAAAWQAVVSGGDVAGAATTAAQVAGGPAPTQTASLAAGQAGQAAAMAISTGLVQTVVFALPTLWLYAANPGDWPNGALAITADTNGINGSAVAGLGLTPAAGQPGFAPSDFFNLSVQYTAPDGSLMSERFTTVSLRTDAGTQRIDRVLANQSTLAAYLAPQGAQTGADGYPTAPQTPPVSGAYGVAGEYANGTQLPPGTPPSNEAPALPFGGSPSAYLEVEDYLGNQATKTGIYALDRFDLFNILCIPPDRRITTTPPALPPEDDDADTDRNQVYQAAAVYCVSRRAFLIIDPPTAWADRWQTGMTQNIAITDLGSYGPEGEYAAVYWPYLLAGDPLQNGALGYFPPSGAMAGIMARTDAARGVWKAPAGINDGAISGVQGLELRLNDADNGLLNPQGINCLRTFPVYGSVVWGARTLKGADVLSSDYKYVPVRRLALYIEDSLQRGMQWAVFEPNAEPLWSNIRLSVGSFMNTLYRQGAFFGSSAKDAYFVKCDATTTTQTDIEQGRVNVVVGFAPLLPAEFVVITIQQIAGQTAS